MNETAAVLLIVQALEELGAEYAISGSFASNFWGEPRATRDVDVVYNPDSLDLGALGERIAPQFALDPQMHVEAITGTLRHVATHRPTGFQAELFILSVDPFDRSRFARRVRADLGGVSATFLAAEDVIIQKLRWLKASKQEKHREDVRKVLAVQRDELDWDYVRRWTDQHQTQDLLDEILVTIK